MAGERIMEALELADGERAAVAAYEADKATLSPEQAARLPPPERNAVLKAYDVSPERYVLNVVEKVLPAALFDALLVLPFGKVVSLMAYLDEWAKRVSVLSIQPPVTVDLTELSGVECRIGGTYSVLPSEDASSPNRRQPNDATHTHSTAHTPSHRTPTTEGHHWVQPCRIAIYPSAA
jgi:hypothetical protein